MFEIALGILADIASGLFTRTYNLQNNKKNLDFFFFDFFLPVSAHSVKAFP